MTARHAWFTVVAVAGVWDYFKRDDQMTDWMRALSIQYPITTRLGLTVLALHLSGDLPKYLDPISGLGWLVAHVR